MDLSLWFSWKTPHGQWRRVCKQQFYTVIWKFWKIKTAAEWPWRNELVECHNPILSDMLDKILHETNCDFELALVWAINAKNSLINIHRFSPYQLSIATNPKLPSLHLSKVSAITSTPTNKTVMKNLEELHKAREAFIASENSEKLKRALSHNIKTSGDISLLQKTQQQLITRSSKSIWIRRTMNLNQIWNFILPCTPMQVTINQ